VGQPSALLLRAQCSTDACSDDDCREVELAVVFDQQLPDAQLGEIYIAESVGRAGTFR
jgi:hypothetical protein